MAINSSSSIFSHPAPKLFFFFITMTCDWLVYLLLFYDITCQHFDQKVVVNQKIIAIHLCVNYSADAHFYSSRSTGNSLISRIYHVGDTFLAVVFSVAFSFLFLALLPGFTDLSASGWWSIDADNDPQWSTCDDGPVASIYCSCLR